MKTMQHPGLVRFGAFKEEFRVNRSNRNLITRRDVERFPQLKAAAGKLDATLSNAGLNTSEGSKQLRMTAVWPHHYIQVVTADEKTLDEVRQAMKAAGAEPEQDSRGLFHYQGVKVIVQTEAERQYEQGLPWTWVAQKFQAARQAFWRKVGFPQIPS